MVEQIEAVRDFNRYYTQRIGALDDHYLGQRRPLGEARLLFEIGAGADLRELRARLGLDAGYLSRLLRSLEGQGLVTVRAHAQDGRVRVVMLTDSGVRERAELDARSRASVGALLGALTPGERDELVAAQARVRRLIRRAGVTIAAVPDDSAEAAECLRSYSAELAVRFPEGYDTSALITPGSTESFLVAHEDGRPVGCVAWCLLPPAAVVPPSASAPAPSASAPAPASPSASAPAPASPSASASAPPGPSASAPASPSASASAPPGRSGSASAPVGRSGSASAPAGPAGSAPAPAGSSALVPALVGAPVPVGAPVSAGPVGAFAEVRHLWVAAGARGLGLGRRLLERVEAEAAERGIRVVRLGTHPALTEAIGLYLSSGYREIARYDSSPYNQLAFERPL